MSSKTPRVVKPTFKSETPRTDELTSRQLLGVIPVTELCRQLETELAEARELVKRIGTVPDSDLILKQKQFLKKVGDE